MPFIKYLISTLLLTSLGYAQMWQQNDNIFNPSGIPSLPFSQPRFADLDGDGDQDLILGSISAAPRYFENTGSASSPHFQPGADLFAEVEELDCEVGVCIDLDADGDLDFISGGFTGLQLYDNIGDAVNGDFVRIDDFFVDLSVGTNPVPHFADLDNDGDNDLVVGYSESGNVRYYQNLGTSESAIFLESESETWFDVGLYAYPWFSDLDSDGDTDLLVGRDGYGFYYYRNDGDESNWNWSDASTQFSSVGQTTYWNSPCLVDLTGDGKPDLVHGSASGPLQYYENSGTNSSASWTAVTSLFGGVLDVGGASNPVFIDFDGDGDLDLVSGSQMGDLKYFENTGNMYGPAWSADHSIFSSIDHSIYSAVAAGDLDDDGLIDLVVGDLSGNLYYHHNTENGFSYQSGMFSGINAGGWSSPRLYDFDLDHDLDLFIGREDGGISYFENTGTAADAQWTENLGLFSGFDVGSNAVLTLGDVNLDRNLDMITGDLFHEIQFFSYESGSWVEYPDEVAGLTASQNATPALVDLNGDGDLDLAIGNYDGTFNYYENLAIVSIDESPVQPQQVKLYPAFPNPFNPTTTIKYDLLESADVSIIIYDVQGHVVKNLLKADRSAGQHTVRWNGLNNANLQVSTGVYFARFTAGRLSDVIKMVYLQ